MTNEPFDDFDTQIQCEELIPAGMEDVDREDNEQACAEEGHHYYPTETPMGEMYGDGFDNDGICEFDE
jgi:hypothetical protein